MSDLLNKFSLDAVKWNPQIAACMIGIWLIVLIAAISSVLSQPFTSKQRFFWILLLVGLPAVGLLAYLPFSLAEARYPLLFSFKKKK
jgi:hypothetical protein